MTGLRMRCLLVLALLTLVPLANVYSAAPAARPGTSTSAAVSAPNPVVRAAKQSPLATRSELSAPRYVPAPASSPAGLPLSSPTDPPSQISVGGSPEQLAFDSTTSDIYVSGCYQSGAPICVIDGNPADATTYHTIVGAVPSISALVSPSALAFDSADHDVYAASYSSSDLGVIDGNKGDGASYDTVIATIPLTDRPNLIAFDPNNDYLYVSTNSYVMVVDGNPSDATYRTVVATISVSNSPQGLVYDPLDKNIYVAVQYADAVDVIDGNAGAGYNTVTGTISSIGTYPQALAFDSADGRIYVTTYTGNTVYMIGGDPTQTATYDQLVGTAISLTSTSGYSYGIAFASTNDALYVTSYSLDVVFQIDGNPADTTTYDTVTQGFVAGQSPWGVSYDPLDGLVYMALTSSGTVGFSGTYYTLTFQETGLDAGTTWYATVDGATNSAITGSIAFTVVPGSFSWSVYSSISCGTDCQFAASTYSGSVTVTAAQSIGVTYQKEYYIISSVSPSTYPIPGSVQIEPSGSSAEWVNAGATVEIIATPAAGGGYSFTGWTPSTPSITIAAYGGGTPACPSGATCNSMTAGAVGTLTADFTFTGGAPTVTGVSPATGPSAGGTSVVITGTDFYSVTSVQFGTTTTGFTVDSPTQITVSGSPAGLGTVDVTVTTPGGTSATGFADQFTYTSPPPTVSGLSKDNGPTAGGASTYVYGTNFLGATAVDFGTVAATGFTVESSSVIYVPSVPAGADAATAGPVDVTVTTPGGTSATSSADLFYYENAPTVTSVSPASGSSVGGTVVTITGKDFVGAYQVQFGTAYGSIDSVTLTALTVTSPTGVGLVDITVTSTQGTSATSTADQFTFVSPVPTVTSVSPATGPASGGTGVYITGTGFVGVSTVMFGGTAAASVTSLGSTEVYAVSPAGTGTVDITVTTPGGTSATGSADQFTYLSLSSISPVSGPSSGGTLVTITGSGFTGVTAVKFGSTAAASFTFVSDSEVTATSPPGAGSVYVTVTTPKGTTATTSSGYFTYLQLTSVSPSTGPAAGGTFVTIGGTGFDQTGGSPVSVYFGTTLATSITVVSDSQVTCFSPPGTTVVDVTVVTSYGTTPTSSADKFTYVVPAPTVTGLTPSTGPAAGGTSVTITGTYFIGVTAVDFGASTSAFVVDSSGAITATAPAGTGAVDVTVTTGSGTSAKVTADVFTYVVIPAVTSLSVTTGPATGGTSVTISGSGFTGATAVDFGTSAASFTFVSDSEITATSPVGVGTVDVTVVNAAGTSPTSAADKFTFIPAISLSSSSGAPSQSVTVSGAGFVASATVSLTYDASALTTTPTTVTVNPDGTFSASFSVPVSAAGAHLVTAKDTSGTTATATYTVTPSVSISPTTGRVGLTITVTGEGFTPGSITITYDGFSAGTATADSTGSFTGTFQAPASVAGSHQVSAVDSLNNAAPPVSYTIKAFITIKVVGTVVYVYGSGYAGTAPVTVDFDGVVVSFTCTTACSTDSSGSFSGSFSLGTSGSVGTVAASDGTDVASQTTPSVPKPPTLPPTGLTVGYILEVDGTGFAADCGVTIYFDGVVVPTTPSTVTTDATGSFTADFVVPPVVYGEHTVTATDCVGNSASQVFKVTPLIAVIPSTGDVGQPVELVGSGFNGSSPITVSFNGATVAGVSSSTNSFGSFTANFDIPATGATHANTIGAVDGSGNSAPGVTFTINVPAVTSVSPNVGTAGTGVTIAGTDLTGATAVYFGGAGASAVTVVSNTEVTAVAPSGSGTVDVTVVTPGGTSATGSADQFSFQVTATASLSDGLNVGDKRTTPASAPLTDGLSVGDLFRPPATATLSDVVGVIDQFGSSLGLIETPVVILFHDPPGYFLVTPPGTTGSVGCDATGTPHDDFASTFATVTGCSTSTETVSIFHPAAGTYMVEVFVTGATPLTVTVESQDSSGKTLNTQSFTASATETFYSTLQSNGSITVSTSAPTLGVPEFPGGMLTSLVLGALIAALAALRRRGLWRDQ